MLQSMLVKEAEKMGAPLPCLAGHHLTIELLAGSYEDYKTARKWIQTNGHSYIATHNNGCSSRALYPEVAVAANAHRQMLTLIAGLFHVSKARAPQLLNQMGEVLGAPQDFTIVQGSSAANELQELGT